MVMPNFLVIGASKCGTTSLHYYLDQHPEIFLPTQKETYFFIFEGSKNRFCGPGDDERLNSRVIDQLEDYEAVFAGASREKAIGEVCPPYMYVPEAAQRILHHIPDAKLIAILRNPIDRAYSSFMHLVREGSESCTKFDDALSLEDERIAKNWRFMWHYTKVGFYFNQLKTYFDLFDTSHLRIYLYDDFSSSPTKLMQNIFQFLEVDDQFVPDMSIRHNATGIPKSRKLRNLIEKPNAVKMLLKPLVPEKLRQRIRVTQTTHNLRRPPLEKETRQKLAVTFRDDVHQLEDLIGRDLSHWLA